jgi:hypothetical protein
MPKLDFKKMYTVRLKQIDIDIDKAIAKRNWTDVAKLRAEKANVQGYLQKCE